MNREQAEVKTCPFKSGVLEDGHGGIYLEEFHCTTEACMMWEAEKKRGDTAYAGECRLKVMPAI
jgi:hypothetical protein